MTSLSPEGVSPQGIDRVQNPGQVLGAELGAMAVMLYSVPRPVESADAIAVFPGLGEIWRVQQAVAAWDASDAARHLLVAGVFPGEKTYEPTTIETLSRPPINMTRTEGVAIQGMAQHTREQADWIVDQVDNKGIGSFALYVSPYHLFRAYCTTVRAFTRSGVGFVPIIPAPVRIPPSVTIPETNVDGWSMFPGEASRIEQYQRKGDVASFGELRDYIDWLWEQPIITETPSRG